MENKVVYVSVSVQEELPPTWQQVSFIHKDGRMLYGKIEGENIEYNQENFLASFKDITHWLKRIELPSEEEIVQAEREFYRNGVKIKPQVFTFRSGINYILSIINQKE